MPTCLTLKIFQRTYNPVLEKTEKHGGIHIYDPTFKNQDQVMDFHNIHL